MSTMGLRDSGQVGVSLELLFVSSLGDRFSGQGEADGDAPGDAFGDALYERDCDFGSRPGFFGWFAGNGL